MKIVYDAIAQHRQKLENGVELAIEIIVAHGALPTLTPGHLDGRCAKWVKHHDLSVFRKNTSRRSWTRYSVSGLFMGQLRCGQNTYAHG